MAKEEIKVTTEDTNSENIAVEAEEKAAEVLDTEEAAKASDAKTSEKKAPKVSDAKVSDKKATDKKGRNRKPSKKKEEDELKKLTPAERKARKKAKKRAQYQAEKAQRKTERYQSSSRKFYNRHKVFTIVSGVILAAAVCVGLAYFLNTGFFRGDSYKFISYSKYVTLGDYDELTYKKSELKVTDKEVEEEIDSRLENADEKKLTKKFIKSNTDNECSTEKEYKAYIREILETQKKMEVGEDLLSEVSGDSKVKKYPSKQYKAAKSEVKSQYETMASQYSMDIDSLIAAMGMDDDSYEQAVKSSAKSTVKLKLVAHAIAKEAGLSMGSSEYKSRLAEFKKQIGLSDSDFKTNTGYSYEDYAENNGYEEYFFQEMVCEYLVNQATAK